MFTVFIIAFIILILSSIEIEVNIDDTIWTEVKTNRPIHVDHYSKYTGDVQFHYPDELLNRTMSLRKLFTEYTLEGRKESKKDE